MNETYQIKQPYKSGSGGGGWSKAIIASFVSLIITFGGVLITTGQYKEKVNQLEVEVEKADKKYSDDHDLLLRIDTKLTNVESLLKTLQEQSKTK